MDVVVASVITTTSTLKIGATARPSAITNDRDNQPITNPPACFPRCGSVCAHHASRIVVPRRPQLELGKSLAQLCVQSTSRAFHDAGFATRATPVPES